MRRGHILESLLVGRDGRFYLRGTCNYLRGLPTCGVVLWAEVRPVVYARFSRPAAHVSGHVAPRSKTLDKLIEGMGGEYVLEGLA